MKTWLGTGIFAALAALAGCGSEVSGGGSSNAAGTPPAEAVTYWQHAKPILDAKCNGCHTQGGIAPFSLETYTAAYEVRGIIKASTQAGTMPPWPPAKGCTDYFSDRSLTDGQMETLAAWVDQGGVEGDATKPGAPIDKGPTNELSRVDRTLEMPVEYTPQKEPDDYRCFVIDWPGAETEYVTGYRANPGNAAVVHHVIAFVVAPADVSSVEAADAAEAGPGYTCYGGPGVKASWIGAWTPGNLGVDNPEGTGIRIEPGSKIVMQVHYNTLTAGAQSDRTTMDFRLEKSVTKEAKIQPWARPAWLSGDGMLIPANESDVMHSFAYDPTVLPPGGPVTIHGLGLHMHQLGKRGLVRIDRADGTTECMIDVPHWDFHWQGTYTFLEPKTVNPGDKVHLECHWDNSAANQPLVDGVKLPPKDVTWGEGTTDEMCLTTLYMTR
jgi:hypothetical protein